MGDQISEHFKLSEFFSGNDKGKTWKAKAPKPELILMLEKIRNTVGVPLRINSGVRSVEHNAELKGSSKNSAHLYGLAADIDAVGLNQKELAAVIKKLDPPELAYAYCITDSREAVHVGVDKDTPRKSKWGPGFR